MRVRLAATVAAVVGAMVLATGGVAGQTASQSPGASAPAATIDPGASLGDAEQPHPAHIHKGSCANLGDVIAPLTNVSQVEAIGDAPSVESSVTTVDLSLENILAAPHAIMAHESTVNIQTYIACADLIGPKLDKNDLVVALAPQNASGFVGVAFLHANGHKTNVYLSLIAPASTTPSGSPSPSIQPFPSSSPIAAGSPTTSASIAP